MILNDCNTEIFQIGNVETNFLISFFAEYRFFASLIATGALFHILMASFMNVFEQRFERPDSINLTLPPDLVYII